MAALVNQRIKNTHFVIIGEGKLENDLKQQAGKPKLFDRIHSPGSISDVPNYLSLCDLGVLTSDSEGLSNALMKYACAGLPVVTFDVGGNNEIVQAGVNGLLAEDGNVAQLAEYAISILSDKNLKHKLSKNGPGLMTELFDPEKIMNQTMSFYQQVAKL